jgi:ABC-type lipoprotein release transport system permease subunit
MPSLAGVAVRNVLRSPRRTLTAVLAIVGGTASLIFMNSANLGVCDMMLTHSVGLMLGHAQVTSAAGEPVIEAEPALSVAAAVDGVAGVAPRLEVPALVGPPGDTRGALLLGVDAPREARVSTLGAMTTEGALPGPADADRVALGAGLAARLHARVGDQIRVSHLDAFNDYHRSKLTVVGVVRTGTEDLDDRLGVVSLATAQRLLDSEVGGAVNRLLVRARANALADAVSARIAARLDPAVYVVRPWHRVSPFLRGMVSFQQGSSNVVLFVMYLVVGAAVAAVQLMGILERTRELGVLASMGISPGRVVALITLETALLGALAVGLGIAAGAAIVTGINHAGGLDTRTTGAENIEGLLGMDPYLHLVMTKTVLLRAAGILLPVVALGGFLPALRAARMTPMEALRRA